MNTAAEKGLNILHAVSLRMLDATSDQDIYTIIADSVKILIPECRFILSWIQPDGNNVRIVEHHGFDPFVEKIIQLLGIDPYTIDFPLDELTDDEMKQYRSRHLNLYRDGIYSLSVGKIPRPVCAVIEQILGVEEVYAMGFSVEETHYGGMMILVSQAMIKQGIWNGFVAMTIETIVNSAALLIRKIRESKMVAEQDVNLRQSEEKFSRAFEINPIPMALSSVRNGKFVEVNEAFTSFTGYNKSELSGKTITELGLFIDPELRKQALAILQETGTLKNFEMPVRIRDGSIRQGLFSGEILKISDQDVLLTVMRDITLQKQSELEKQIHAEKIQLMQKENIEARDKFMSIIAHDLRSPFSVIYGFSEILARESSGFNPEMTMNLASKVFQSADNYLKLLDNLLIWSRTQTGKMPFEPILFDLRQMMSEETRLHEAVAQKKNIQINASDTDELWVLADLDMIKTVFRNILVNAIKYSYPGGIIEIRSWSGNHEVLVSVRDFGMGISRERKTGLFTLGNSVSTVGTAHEKGTGLGLLLCREFIEKHEGRIWVESEAGEGSTFGFALPADHSQ